MRTYLINDNEEIIVDLTRTKVHEYNLVEFDFSTLADGERSLHETMWLKKICGQYFISKDQKSWKKIPRQDLPSRIVSVDKVYSVFRGYKPSGLGGSDEGELLTKMPGKIVKINVEEGQTVKKGETLIILEAMKMENEIKAGVDGVVKIVNVKEGQNLESGHLMIEIEE